jgi:hypothetical protein
MVPRLSNCALFVIALLVAVPASVSDSQTVPSDLLTQLWAASKWRFTGAISIWSFSSLLRTVPRLPF